MSLKLGSTDISALSPGAIRLGANSLDRVYDGTQLVWERGFKYTHSFTTLTNFTQTSSGSGVGVASGIARWNGTTDGQAILKYNSQARTTNQYGSVVIANASGNAVGIILHCDAGNTGYYACAILNSRVSLFRTSGRWNQNAYTTITFTNTTVSANSLVEFWNIQDRFFIAVNGVIQVDFTIPSPVIDSSHLYQGFGMFRATFVNSASISQWNGGDAGAWGKI
ncbi:hypothetical protein I8H83_02830 [Candidatus Saccharibacteria bacterium]|nr:hypothetical protein [Candidatus Saccharibacteria bacterium]MBH2007512.1 hypothetical protein [Candidatus Saccharibacteria bacterium]